MGELVTLTEDKKKRLLKFLQEEDLLAKSEVYDPLQAKHEELNKLYYGETEPRSEDWMSNFPILMGATFTDATSARFLNTMFAYKPTFTLEPTRNSSWMDVAKHTEDFMEFKVKTEMKLYREMRKVVFEACRLGTGALLMPWVRRTERVPVKRLLWTSSMEVELVNGIVMKALPLRDLIYPGGYSEVEDLPWWSRKMHWTPMNLKIQKRKKLYFNIDKVVNYQVPAGDAEQAEAQQRAGEEPGMSTRILGRETYLWHDMKDDGDYRKYICTWHPDANEILRLEEDTYPSWPLKLFRYGPRDYGIMGLGVMEMSAPYDNALYSLYNLLVDNFKVSTMACFAAVKGTGIKADTVIRPAKIFILNNIEDLRALPMGQPYNLNPAFARMVWELGERRTGISDYALGRESAGSGGTATGTLALIQEGQRRFDLTIRDFREGMDDVGMFVLTMQHKHLPREQPYMVLGENGKWVQQFLDMPSSLPYLSLGIKSSMSHVALNKEIEKQDALATFQLLEKYYQSVTQLLLLMSQVPPEVAATLQKIAKAAALKLKKVLETFGEMTPEVYTDIIPEGAAQAAMQRPPMMQGGPGAGAQ